MCFTMGDLVATSATDVLLALQANYFQFEAEYYRAMVAAQGSQGAAFSFDASPTSETHSASISSCMQIESAAVLEDGDVLRNFRRAFEHDHDDQGAPVSKAVALEYRTKLASMMGNQQWLKEGKFTAEPMTQEVRRARPETGTSGPNILYVVVVVSGPNHKLRTAVVNYVQRVSYRASSPSVTVMSCTDPKHIWDVYAAATPSHAIMYRLQNATLTTSPRLTMDTLSDTLTISDRWFVNKRVTDLIKMDNIYGELCRFIYFKLDVRLPESAANLVIATERPGNDRRPGRPVAYAHVDQDSVLVIKSVRTDIPNLVDGQVIIYAEETWSEWIARQTRRAYDFGGLTFGSALTDRALATI